MMKTKFALVGNNMVTLKEFEKQEKAKVEGSALRMARSRSPQTARAPPPAPWKQQEAPKRRSPSPRARPATQQIEQNEDMYQELHTKISSRSFNSRVAQALSSIKEIVEQHCFLNVVFFVKGLPTEGHQKWMVPLLRSVKATLSLNFPSDLLASMDCTDDSVRMDVKGGLVVNVRFSPAFENYVETVQALGMLGPYARKPFEPSFVKERTQFVAKQPGHVKVTMRLMKWWRDQQAWSCPLTTPSDYVP